MMELLWTTTPPPPTSADGDCCSPPREDERLRSEPVAPSPPTLTSIERSVDLIVSAESSSAFFDSKLLDEEPLLHLS